MGGGRKSPQIGLCGCSYIKCQTQVRFKEIEEDDHKYIARPQTDKNKTKNTKLQKSIYSTIYSKL